MYNTIAKFITSRGLTVYRFAKDTGLPLNTCYRLNNNPESIPTGEVMDAILNTYPDARVGDLLMHQPEDK